MSTLKEDNVMFVRNTACDRLLDMRVETKVQGKRMSSVMNRIHVAMPKLSNSDRKPCIPEGVVEARARRDAGEKIQTEKDLEESLGGAGVYSADLRKGYILEEDDWKYDIMPEIWDGHNIMDFVDPDIDAKLQELEQEEEELEVCIVDACNAFYNQSDAQCSEPGLVPLERANLLQSSCFPVQHFHIPLRSACTNCQSYLPVQVISMLVGGSHWDTEEVHVWLNLQMMRSPWVT